MPDEKDKKNNADAPVQPDPETLHTTDPQEEMKGPVSTFMNDLKEGVEEATHDTMLAGSERSARKDQI